jgi:indolepyruvate ferredoxin oxidoreductase
MSLPPTPGRPTLEDKYTLLQGSVWMSSLQALVRLPLEQARRDRAAGLNTAGFVSGYRGSPLGSYDLTLWPAQKHLDEHDIRFMPAVNEDLAAACIRGTQWASHFKDAKQQGVFSLWYGKHLGTERACEALKQGNYDGSSRYGGVLVVTGDDMGGKSSVTAAETEHVYITAQIPLLYPANTHEILEFGLYGWAMSRFCGLWIGLKTVTDTAEMSSVVSVGPELARTILPEVARPSEGLNAFRGDYYPLPQERRLSTFRLPAAKAFVRANGLDRVIFDSPRRRLGIVAAGKVYLDVREALRELGIDARRAAELGLRLYKPGMVWPLEDRGAIDFCKGHEEILVIDEKRPVLEDQLARLLYGLPNDQRPRLLGKRDGEGRVLVPEHGERSVHELVEIIARRMLAGNVADLALKERIRAAEEKRQLAVVLPTSKLVRTPYFCSGCPHNSSTKTVDGSMTLTGTGCYGLIPMVMPHRPTEWVAQMGAEGMPWVGMHAFVETPHAFQNLGDGTYFHSGVLAVRQAIASGANITFKILYNDAVAMTGGQPLDGELTVEMLANQLYWEGVKRITIVTDEPHKYPNDLRWPAGTTVHHREQLETVQRELQQVKGTSVLIYDQVCAAEKRRRRKRGLLSDPPQRIFINQAVCEGCGDCTVQSNCVSVVPVETELGTKRRIDQSNCNKDYSCAAGFCPSFVSVTGATLRKSEKTVPRDEVGALLAAVPEPGSDRLTSPHNLLLTGIGGTGVLTVAAVLGMAAYLDGRAATVMDVTGMAQKGGTVLSFIRIGDRSGELFTPRLWARSADVVIGCDLLTSTGMQATDLYCSGITRLVVNSDLVPTAQFQSDTSTRFDQADDLVGALRIALGVDHVEAIAGTTAATYLMGDSIATNVFMLGFAFQHGLVPLSATAIEAAITLNAISVVDNLRAFAWGRLAAYDRAGFDRRLRALHASEPRSAMPVLTLDELIAQRAAHLESYQDARYAARYRAVVDRVRRSDDDALTRTVAHVLAKLMAYKDEYEVARLYTEGRFKEQLRGTFEGNYELKIHLAPPLLSRRDPVTGYLKKRQFGPWILHAFLFLARLRRLRGTWCDPFGYTAERREERALISHYEALVERVLARLGPGNRAEAITLLGVFDQVRGFGHVKAANLARAREQEIALRARFDAAAP